MNQVYRDLILSRAYAAIGAANAVRELRHTGLKGQLREIVIRDLLRPLLPKDIGIGSGQIISAYNQQQSRQEDVILYDRRVLPPILFEEVYGVFPIESVLFVIEVKSTLTFEELATTHSNALQLESFQLAPGVDNTPILRADYNDAESHMSCVVAFGTDLAQNGKSEIERYDEIRGATPPAIQSLCVINRGYWSWDSKKWYEWPTHEPAEELMHFATDILNNYQRIASTRLSPDFRDYVYKE